MTSNTQSIVGAAITLLLLVGGGYYVYTDLRPAPFEESGIPLTPGVATTTPMTVTMAMESSEPNIPVPDLNRPITFPVSFSAEAQRIMRQKILSLADPLTSNPP